MEEVSAVSNCKKYLSSIIHALDGLVVVLKPRRYIDLSNLYIWRIYNFCN